MGYDKLYDQSWDLYKKEMMVSSLDSMMMGKIISTFLDRGYYLLKLQTEINTIRARFDRGKTERVRIDLTMHNLDLGDLYSFGGISHLTVWKGVQRDLSGFLGGQVKEALSMVRGSPEPGVYMVMQDGTSYFVGTTVYFNIKQFCDLDSYTVDVDEIMDIIDDVLEEILRMDSNLEVV
ncbi:MAG: hypothetical protein ACMUIG_10580 [Thermoplasmatota archaeon]